MGEKFLGPSDGVGIAEYLDALIGAGVSVPMALNAKEMYFSRVQLSRLKFSRVYAKDAFVGYEISVVHCMVCDEWRKTSSFCLDGGGFFKEACSKCDNENAALLYRVNRLEAMVYKIAEHVDLPVD